VPLQGSPPSRGWPGWVGVLLGAGGVGTADPPCQFLKPGWLWAAGAAADVADPTACKIQEELVAFG